jgi:hypothetical protein
LNNKYIKSKNESENEICKCKYIGNWEVITLKVEQ